MQPAVTRVVHPRWYRAFYGCLSIMIESEATNAFFAMYLPLIQLVVESLQLMALSMPTSFILMSHNNSNTGSNASTNNLFLLWFITHVPLTQSIYQSLWGFTLVLLVSVLLLLCTLAAPFWLGATKIPHTLAMPSAHVIRFCLTIPYIPILNQLVERMYRNDSLLATIVSGCCIPVLILVVLLILLNNYQADLHSTHVLRRPHTRADLILLMVKSSVGAFVFLRDDHPMMFCSFVVLCVLMLLVTVLLLQPYYVKGVTRLRSGLLCAALSFDIVVLLTLFVESNITSSTGMIVFYVSAGGAALFGGILGSLLPSFMTKSYRFECWMLSKFTTLDAKLSSADLYALQLEETLRSTQSLGLLGEYLIEQGEYDSAMLYLSRALSKQKQGTHNFIYNDIQRRMVRTYQVVRTATWDFEYHLHRLPTRSVLVGVNTVHNPTEVSGMSAYRNDSVLDVPMVLHVWRHRAWAHGVRTFSVKCVGTTPSSTTNVKPYPAAIQSLVRTMFGGERVMGLGSRHLRRAFYMTIGGDLDEEDQQVLLAIMLDSTRSLVMNDDFVGRLSCAVQAMLYAIVNYNKCTWFDFETNVLSEANPRGHVEENVMVDKCKEFWEKSVRWARNERCTNQHPLCIMFENAQHLDDISIRVLDTLQRNHQPQDTPLILLLHSHCNSANGKGSTGSSTSSSATTSV
eukprot:PhF_6_TR27953/c0_g1_i3/m.41254